MMINKVSDVLVVAGSDRRRAFAEAMAEVEAEAEVLVLDVDGSFQASRHRPTGQRVARTLGAMVPASNLTVIDLADRGDREDVVATILEALVSIDALPLPSESDLVLGVTAIDELFAAARNERRLHDVLDEALMSEEIWRLRLVVTAPTLSSVAPHLPRRSLMAV
jgi:hypothetical protein